MKQIVMTIVAAVMFSSAAMAQDQEKGKKKEEMIKHRTEMMVKDYNLDDKQAKQLLELNTKYANKMRPGRHGHHQGMKGDRPEPPKGERPEPPKDDKKCCDCKKPSKEEMKAKHKEREESMKAYEAELQKILTPDQYKSYQADKEKHHKKGPRPQPKD